MRNKKGYKSEDSEEEESQQLVYNKDQNFIKYGKHFVTKQKYELLTKSKPKLDENKVNNILN